MTFQKKPYTPRFEKFKHHNEYENSQHDHGDKPPEDWVSDIQQKVLFIENIAHALYSYAYGIDAEARTPGGGKDDFDHIRYEIQSFAMSAGFVASEILKDLSELSMDQFKQKYPAKLEMRGNK